MITAIEFTTTRYECVHGRKPRGYSLWYFRMPDGVTYSHQGTFGAAKHAAAGEVRRRYPWPVVRVQVWN